MFPEVGSVLRAHVISESHDEHVTTFFKRHILIIPVWVASCVGIAGTHVVHRVLVGIMTGLLVLKQRIQQQLEHCRVGVHERGVGRKDDVDSVYISVRGYFL